MIIDAHVNISQDGKWFQTEYDASLERLMEEMNEAGIDKCLLISMPFVTKNEYIASVVEKFPEKFRGLGHIDLLKGDIISQVEDIMSMGLSGIKIHPRLQGVDCNNPELKDFFEYHDENQHVLMIDGYYTTIQGGVSLSDLEPFKYDLLAKTYPNTKFIVSHMGGHRAFDLFFVAKSNRNVFIDNSHVLKYFYDTSLIQDMVWIMDKLDEKIIYGSDFPEYGLSEYLDQFIRLTEETKTIRQRKIFTNITKLIQF